MNADDPTRQRSTPLNLVVVPARGGSKGVPGKNLRVLNGRSLLARAIDCARAATSIDLIVVSTDDDGIAAEAEAEGATVVRRPVELATDAAPTPPVVVDVIERLAEPVANVVLLQPPAPLRTGADVDAVIERLDVDDGIDSMVSVYQVGDTHPGRMYEIGDDGVLASLFPDQENLRRQELPPVFHRNGAIYATRVPALLETGALLAGRVGAYVMDDGWTVNIDTPEDLLTAELIVSRWDVEVGKAPTEESGGGGAER